MSGLSRLLLCVAAVLGTAFLVVRIEVASTDWYLCFNGLPGYKGWEAWRIALKALTHPSKETLYFAVPVLPTLFAIALSPRLKLQLVAFAPMATLLGLALLETGTMHSCDRKGCEGCVGVFLWMLLIQLPIGTLLFAGLGLHRLMDLWSRTRTRVAG